MFIDKVKAEKNRWRIPENTLFTITMIGGGIGSIIGMYVCRHKTQTEYILIIYVWINYF